MKYSSLAVVCPFFFFFSTLEQCRLFSPIKQTHAVYHDSINCPPRYRASRS